MTHKEKQLKQAEKELWRITNFSMSRYTDRQREMIDRINVPVLYDMADFQQKAQYEAPKLNLK